MCFYGQYTAIAEKLEELTTNMRQHFAQNEPVAGAYTGKYILKFVHFFKIKEHILSKENHVRLKFYFFEIFGHFQEVWSYIS